MQVRRFVGLEQSMVSKIDCLFAANGLILLSGRRRTRQRIFGVAAGRTWVCWSKAPERMAFPWYILSDVLRFPLMTNDVYRSNRMWKPQYTICGMPQRFTVKSMTNTRYAAGTTKRSAWTKLQSRTWRKNRYYWTYWYVLIWSSGNTILSLSRKRQEHPCSLLVSICRTYRGPDLGWRNRHHENWFNGLTE